MKKLGKFEVRVRIYSNDVFQREITEKRNVYADRYGSPYINDTLHGCRVFCMGENPYWYRTDSYSVKSVTIKDVLNGVKPTPHPPFVFSGLYFKRYPSSGNSERGYGMMFEFTLPDRGCVSTFNAIQEVFGGDGQIETSSITNPGGLAIVQYRVPSPMESTFIEWARIRSIDLEEIG
jgi:hypothetical protein